MTGVRITITVQDEQAQAAVGRLLSFAHDMSVPMDRAGEKLIGWTRDRAERQVDPDGIAWAPLSPRYARRKAKRKPGAPILKYDNHMLGDRLVRQSGPTFVQVGTGVPYGATHQFGRGGIPARRWLGLAPDERAELLDIFGSYVSTDLLPG